MNILYIVTYTYVVMMSSIYIWHRLLNKKINFKSIKIYITLNGMVFFSIANYSITNKYLKILFATIILVFFFKYLFNENIHKSIITPIYQQFIIMISETIFAAIITTIFHYNAENLISNYLGSFFVNIIVAIIAIMLVQFRIIRKLYFLIINMTDKIKPIQLIVFGLIIMAISNILAMTSYYKIDFIYQLIFNVIMIISCSIIVIYSLKTKNNYNKVYDKYNIAINSLKDYEEMMNKYKVSNHENKNILLSIRTMIKSKDEDIVNYIDTVVTEKYLDDEKLFKKMNVIPSGGLRASIYTEILKIKNHKINYNLSIDKDLKTIDLIELDTNTIIDICKIIGVFIDNAIEEVINIKRKYIDINLYLDEDKINIEVSNNYISKIEIEKIYNIGYTTKGKGHGYGLSLVKKIIDENNKLENKIKISKDVFTQIISIKYKKKK